MCTTCGCSQGATLTVTNLQTGHTSPLHPGHMHTPHDHGHSHEHGHTHTHEHHSHPPGTILRLDQEILAKNNRLAERNRGWLASRGILALNLVSAPGAGKTTLLQRTLCDLREAMSFQIV